MQLMIRSPKRGLSGFEMLAVAAARGGKEAPEASFARVTPEQARTFKIEAMEKIGDPPLILTP